MTDIVERAHFYVANTPASTADPLIVDMADEIERLRRDIELLEGGATQYKDEAGRLRAELVRERAHSLELTQDSAIKTDEIQRLRVALSLERERCARIAESEARHSVPRRSRHG